MSGASHRAFPGELRFRNILGGWGFACVYERKELREQVRSLLNDGYLT